MARVALTCEPVVFLHCLNLGLLLVVVLSKILNFIHEVKNLVLVEKIHLYLIVVVHNIRLDNLLLSDV